MRISACYIVKDEAEELRRSMHSIRGQADEIIVVQTADCEPVRQAAEEAGARVSFFTWQDDFAAARNFALAQATGDWLLLLDADEYFTKETAGNLRRLTEAHKESEGLLVPLTNLGKQGEELLTAPALRLVRRQSGLAYIGRIHEELRVEGKALQDVRLLTETELHILHTGYCQEVNKSKAERNLRLLRQELKGRQAKGEAADSLYMYLAEACYGLGQTREAEHWARQDMALGRRQVLYASRSWQLLLALLAKQDRPEDRLQAAMQAAEVFPELPEFHAELAAARASWGDFAGAAQAMETALSCRQPCGLEPVQFTEEMREAAGQQLAQWKQLAEKAATLSVSACLIVRDELEEIRSWLPNAAAYADEIIVTDTGSVDGTREYALEAGAAVYDFPWQNDFAKARNYTIEQARQDWIVFLDADETFYHPEGVRGLMAVTLEREPSALAFAFTQQNVDTDAGGMPMDSAAVVRAFRRRPDLRYGGRVHEQLLQGTMHVAVITVPEALIRHTGYSAGKLKRKAERDLRILYEEIKAVGQRQEHWRFLAGCYYVLEDYDMALGCARQALREAKAWLDDGKELYWLVLRCLERLQRPLAEQLLAVQDLQSQFPGETDVQIAAGILQWRAGHMEQAENLLRSALQRGGGGRKGMMPREELEGRAMAVLGQIELSRGRWEEAEELSLAALDAACFEPETLALAAKLWPRGEILLQRIRTFFKGVSEGQLLSHLYGWAVRTGQLRLALHFQELLQGEGEKLPEAPLCRECLQEGAQPGRQVQLEQEAARLLQRYFLELLRRESGEAGMVLSCRDKELLPPAFVRLLSAWQSGEPLQPEEAETWHIGISVLLGQEDRGLDQRYAELGLALPSADLRRGADRFFARESWAAAFTLYQAIPADETGEAGSFWHHLGLTLYHLGEFAAAGECLERAQAAGSAEQDLASFLQWSRERSAS